MIWAHFQIDDVGVITDLEPEGWLQAVEQRVKLMHTVLQSLYSSLEETGSFLIAATRMGGRHGYDAAGATAPLGGAVSGGGKLPVTSFRAALIAHSTSE